VPLDRIREVSAPVAARFLSAEGVGVAETREGQVPPVRDPGLEPLIVPVHGHAPEVSRAAFLAPGAVLIGAVTLGEGVSIWYGCVLRADTATITVGRDVNIQDGCILHADPDFPALLGDRVSLGHGAIVHGATVEDEVLIGMRATVLNGAHIGRGSVVAAGALVRPGVRIPPGSLVAGVPGVVRREVNDEERELIARTTRNYLRHAAVQRAAVEEVRLSR
jgi:carbonic anhydrase/acetyltransferase-like protein (isoleucine patch superfamily)